MENYNDDFTCMESDNTPVREKKKYGKLVLSIDPNYLTGKNGKRKWGLKEAIREFVQNWADAKTKGATTEIGVIARQKAGSTLRIYNSGEPLSRQTLLLGNSSKRNDDSQRGQFGEGYKLGMLAALNAERKVCIRTGYEEWVPLIEQSDTFGTAVLKVNIKKREEYTDGVEVLVWPFSPEEWALHKEMFLFLSDAPQYRTSFGSLLTDEKHIGRVFVKGIFVTCNKELGHGYDLLYGNVDRDRQMITDFDLGWYTSAILAEAIAKNGTLLQKEFRSLCENTKRTDTFYLDKHLVPDSQKEFLQLFYDTYGQEAVPVTNMDESKTATLLGSRGIIVPETLAKALYDAGAKTLAQTKKIKENTPLRIYSFHELNAEEQKNYSMVHDLIKSITTAGDFTNFMVGDFAENDSLGLHTMQDGTSYISRKVLATFDATFQTMLHEYCHRHGYGDGTREFADEITTAASKIVFGLLRQLQKI